MKMFVVNLVLAVLWLLLSPDPSLPGFFVGLAIGFGVIAIFSAALGGLDYVRRTLALVRFLGIFIREFLIANVNVARIVLFGSRESLHPNFITYDVAGLSSFEILLLSYCVSLTPGTTTVQVEGDFQTLILHALNAENPREIREMIDRNLKKPILSFTR